MRGNTEERGKKLFIGGLHMKTTEESLRGFYSQWGEIIDCVVMKDNQTGRSRGFGFVTYKDIESVDLAQSNRPHEIDGINVDSKRAMPKEDTSPEFHASVNRLFLGRLRKDITNEQVNEYFGQFGAITDAVVIKSPSGESRGFGFVTFEDTDSVDKVIVSRPHTIDGHTIEVKKAQPKDKGNSQSNTNPNPRSGNRMPGRGGARQNNVGQRYPMENNSYGAYPSSNMGYNSGYQQNQGGYQQSFSGMPPTRYNEQPMQAPAADNYRSEMFFNGGGGGGYSQPPTQPNYGGNYGQYDTPSATNGSGRYGYPAQASTQLGEYNQRAPGGGPVRGGAKFARGGPQSYPY